MNRLPCFFLFGLVYLGTKWFELGRTIQFFSWLGKFQRRFFPSKHITLDDIETVLKQSYDLMPFRILCLDQAILYWYFLNRYGYPAVMKIGLTIFPVASHAWVEVEGRVFVDTAYLSDLRVMAEYPAWSNNDRKAFALTPQQSS